MACLGETWRASSALTMNGHSPRSISGMPKLALSRASTTSQPAAKPDAAGQAEPLHPSHDRDRALPHRDDKLGQQAAALVLLESGRVVGHDGEIGAGTEDPVAGRGDHDDVDVVVARDAARPPRASPA